MEQESDTYVMICARGHEMRRGTAKKIGVEEPIIVVVAAGSISFSGVNS